MLRSEFWRWFGLRAPSMEGCDVVLLWYCLLCCELQRTNKIDHLTIHKTEIEYKLMETIDTYLRIRCGILQESGNGERVKRVLSRWLLQLKPLLRFQHTKHAVSLEAIFLYQLNLNWSLIGSMEKYEHEWYTERFLFLLVRSLPHADAGPSLGSVRQNPFLSHSAWDILYFILPWLWKKNLICIY